MNLTQYIGTQGEQHVWQLYVRSQDATLWIRCNNLRSKNGFRQDADITAVLTDHDHNHLAIKTSLNHHQPSTFPLTFGPCTIALDASHGTLVSKRNAISWNLTFSPCQMPLGPFPLASMMHAPRTLAHLTAQGTLTWGGKTIDLLKASATITYLHTSQLNHSWVLAYAPDLSRDISFEGLSTRMNLGFFHGPEIASLRLIYEGQAYDFQSFKDALSMHTKRQLSEWRFQADRGDLSFRGHIRSAARDLAGVTLEDTDGSLLFCNQTCTAEMSLLVYRAGKLVNSAHAPALFESVSSMRNPYVPNLL